VRLTLYGTIAKVGSSRSIYPDNRFSDFPDRTSAALEKSSMFMSSSQSPTFTDLEILLDNAGIDTTVAEAHGIVTGVLSVPARETEPWLPLILGPEQTEPAEASAELPEQLFALWHQTEDQLQRGEFDFVLLLPDETAGLQERIGALADWCRGYLLGLAHAGVSDESAVKGDGAEFLGDIERIAEVEIEPGDGIEDQEQALTELEEYVRMGVQLVYEELCAPSGASAP
jgi:yecA family protein